MHPVRKWIVLAIALTACGGDDGGPSLPTVDCSPPVPTFSQVRAFNTNCTMCHALALPYEARSGAPVGMDYDVYASAVAVGDATASTVFQMTMPPSGGLFPADKEALYKWTLCGMPQ